MTEERGRILDEYARREREVDKDLYAPWNAAEENARSRRRLLAATLFHELECFPEPGEPVLEVGYGRLGWLADLLTWGLRQEDLHGIELDPARAAVARRTFPAADLRVGDAETLPWDDGSFQLVVASTVFTSVLDDGLRRRMGSEIERVLCPGGALVWYDFRFDNPKNSQVRGIGSRELRKLFPGLAGRIRSTTLAPPLGRPLAGPLPWLAALLEAFPFLRSHLVAVLRKAGPAGEARG